LCSFLFIRIHHKAAIIFVIFRLRRHDRRAAAAVAVLTYWRIAAPQSGSADFKMVKQAPIFQF
jgi:hypothetical protein